MHEKIYIGALLVAIGTFHAATVRQGHIWSDDFAMYVHHAQNIAERLTYADTGYIINASIPIGPKYYPPIFPMLLAPIYRASGLDLVPMKLEQVIFLLLSLMTIYAYWKRDLGSGYTLALVAILGFAPAFWTAKDNVLSDVLFLFLFYLTSLLVRSTIPDKTGWSRWSVVTGFAVYLAIGTRIVGTALAAGLVLYDVVRLRTVSRSTAVSIAVCGGLLALQSYLMRIGQNGYLYQRPTLHTIVRSAAAYSRALASFWVGSTRSFFAYVVLALFASLILKGLFVQWKRGFTFVEAALIVYLAIIVAPPSPGGVRMAFPVVPWIGYLALSGLRSLAERRVPRCSHAAAWALFLLAAIPYGQFYSKANFGPIRETDGLPEFNQLCQAVRDNTESQDPIIYFRARALSLYTGRPASVPNYLGDQAELWRWAWDSHSKYLVTTNAFNDDHGFLIRFADDNAHSLELVYENVNFKLYRIRSFPIGLELPTRLYFRASALDGGF